MRRLFIIFGVVAAAILECAGTARAQASSPRPWGRVSFFTNAARISAGDGVDANSSEFITSVSFQTPEGDGEGLEYGVDIRHSGSTVEGRDARVSIYDGYVGARLLGGALRVRFGHMWLNDLGALGSVAGALGEYRRPQTLGRAGHLRVGVFGGFEPDLYEAGYAGGVRKIGVYAALDGEGARRHVIGYVNVRHSGLTERSVLSVTNFLPAGQKVFVYQLAEYDLARPAGVGQGGLSYFFTNARVSPADRIEVLASYHRGRSVDARSLADDILTGRPIPTRLLDALLFQSAGGRLTVEVLRGVRANVGYWRDTNNQGERATGRLTLGGYASNLAGSGLDVTLTDSRNNGPTGTYHSLYLSVGHQLGRTVYLSGDYSSSVSLVRFDRGDGFFLETRPRSRRLSASSVINVSRYISLLVTADHTQDDDVSELRVLAGLTYRFR